MVKALMEKIKATIHESSQIHAKTKLEFTHLEKLLTVIEVCKDEDLKKNFYENVLNAVKVTFTHQNLNQLLAKFEWKIIKEQVLRGFKSFNFDAKINAIQV
jgi:hypothetical protein